MCLLLEGDPQILAWFTFNEEIRYFYSSRFPTRHLVPG